LIAAHRFFCAAAIRLRTAALIPRFLAGTAAFFATLAGAGFAAFLTAAQRFRCASPIRLRAAALNLRRFAAFLTGEAVLSMLDSSTRAFWSLSSSASIAAMIEFVSIRIFLSRKSYSNLIYNLEPSIDLHFGGLSTW
jgi:hypothetical protein